MQEHAVRRGAARGPRGAHHRCRAHRLRIRLIHPGIERARRDCCGWAPLPLPSPSTLSREGSVLPFNPTLLPAYVAALALGYLSGSIPFGLILTRLAGTPDIRTIGSGNIGATNVLRTGRKGLAAATLLADALKGTAAVLL